MVFFDGRVYKGEWKNNEMHGQGEFFWPDNERKYKGSYKKGKKDGFGMFESREIYLARGVGIDKEGKLIKKKMAERIIVYDGGWKVVLS